MKLTNFNELRSSKESKLKTSLFNEIGEFKAFNAKKKDKTSYFNVLRISRKLRHLSINKRKLLISLVYLLPKNYDI